jgi:hypothetical protein
MAAYTVGFLFLGVVIMFAGLYLFGCRDPIGWQVGPCPEIGFSFGSGLYTLERSLIAASVIATAIGLGMLSELTRGTAGFGPAKAGASLYTFGAVLIVAVELALADSGRVFPGAEALVVGYVVLAFLGEAALGWGLVKGIEGMRIVGWVTILLNLSGLTYLLLASRDDMYFPIAHVVMPAVIAVTLLIRSRMSPNEAGIGATKVRNHA